MKLIDEVRAFSRAIVDDWTALVSGAVGLVAAAASLFVLQGWGAKRIFAATAMVGLVVAAFRIWRAEWRKTAETDEQRVARDDLFADRIGRLGPAQRLALRALVRDGHAMANAAEMLTLNNMVPELVFYGERTMTPSPIYLRRLELHFKLRRD